jgi:hypothetical protein
MEAFLNPVEKPKGIGLNFLNNESNDDSVLLFCGTDRQRIEP